MAIIRTINVVLKDGAHAVINASDFDDSVHTVPTAKKKIAEPVVRHVPRKKPISGGTR